jgi:putative transcriptional regulator
MTTMKAESRRHTAPARRRAGSPLLAAVHGSIKDLQKAGVIDQATMREFDAMCLAPVDRMKPREIVALRRRERVSQPVFAAHLNVRKHTVSRWERGEAVPEGAALKLLDVIKRKGLKALA